MPGSVAASAMYLGVPRASGEEKRPTREVSGEPGLEGRKFSRATVWKGSCPSFTNFISLSEMPASSFSPERLELYISESQRVANNRYRAKCHRRARNHWT